jgi:cytochrome b
MLRRREPRHLGHNPLGGWMTVILLLTVALVGLSGWLYTTDRFWGVEWVERLHSTLADALLALAAVHVAGAIYASFRHRENLVAAMVHGRKRAAGD